MSNKLRKKGSSTTKKQNNPLFNKKQIICGSFITSLAIIGITGGILLNWSLESDEEMILISTYDGFWINDTLYEEFPGWTKAESTEMVLNQILEGLFEYEINEYTVSIKSNLALDGIWSSDGLNFTCVLREGVKFHDGINFNATAVKWNFDRLLNLLDNISNSEIWFHSDGKAILNRTEIINDYMVKFVLNRPFVPFKSLLCSIPAYILSPRFTPPNDFIDSDVKIVGTGPFEYEHSTYSYNTVLDEFFTLNTTLLANDEYWAGSPKIDKLVFQRIDDDTERYEKMIAGDIHYTHLWPYHIEPEMYTNYTGFSLHYIVTPIINYIIIKNNLINSTMRKALSYAFNYSKYLDFERNRWEGGVIRARSPLSKGMLFSNWQDFNLPYYNISFARKLLKDANWNGTAGSLSANDNISIGNEWESLVTNGTPLATYNFTYHASWDELVFLKSLVVENYKQLGIKINPIPATWIDWWDKLAWSHFILGGWNPPYNDPRNNINPLFSNKADGDEYNWGRVNDSILQEWMEAGLIELNESKRAELYYNMQKRLIEEIFPFIWTYTEVYCNVHGSNLRGIDYNLVPYKLLFKDAYFG